MFAEAHMYRGAYPAVPYCTYPTRVGKFGHRQEGKGTWYPIENQPNQYSTERKADN